MRLRAILAGLFGLLLFTVGAVPEASAQNVPPGSYLRSCRDVRVVAGRDITALCETRQPGRFEYTRLPDFRSCWGDIANINGNLRCERRPAPPPPGPNVRPPPPPPGSYLRSCRGAVVGPAGTLWAECRMMNGVWVRANVNLNNCRGARDIANINGRLVCNW
ncbi:CVNH domain-containing protein [Xanthobacter tagetidis]|nr:CVNH domain-containing protein [Xanthobacter tagetidis]MBB6308323.1 hypothetical protein [Xanthobacter tagetidis]